MMQRNAVRGCCGLLAGLLCSGICSVPAAAEETAEQLYREIPVQRFAVSGILPQADGDLNTVYWEYIDWADCRYLFLPASADRSRLTITYETEKGVPLYLNDTAVQSGAETGLLHSADVFSVRAGEQECGELHVMQSNLGSISLALTDGEPEQIDLDRDAAAAGIAWILDAEGNVQYSGALEQISGRGHSSWAVSPKKPYHIKLAKKAALFGMGRAKKWELLSLYADHSLLRNEIAFAMSRQAGLRYTTDSAFADLYIDGRYRGVYQLTERVQVHPARIDLRDLAADTQEINDRNLSDYPRTVIGGTLNGEEPNSYQYYEIPHDPADITGGYLVQFQFRNRAKNAEIITNSGQIFDIEAPAYPSKAQTEYLRDFLQALEDAIYSDTGINSAGRHYSEYLDVDSLILGYLIQEITENADGAASSFYFYKDSDLTGDGKLHYGPVWDFDLSCLNYSRIVTAPDGTAHMSGLPDQLYALYVPIGSYDPETAAESGVSAYSWLMKLWEKDAFARRTAVLYEERFDRFLTELTEPENGLIAGMRDALLPAAEMNRIRWHMFGGRPYKPFGAVNGESYPECVEFVRHFLAERQGYLREIFLHESLIRCASALDTMYADALPAYDAPEQKTVAAQQKAYTGKLRSAASAAEAEQLLQAAEDALDTIPRAYLQGDFDESGSVDLDDAQMLLIYYTDWVAGIAPTLNATRQRNGDYDKNGILDAADAMLILQYYTDFVLA